MSGQQTSIACPRYLSCTSRYIIKVGSNSVQHKHNWIQFQAMSASITFLISHHQYQPHTCILAKWLPSVDHIIGISGNSPKQYELDHHNLVFTQPHLLDLTRVYVMQVWPACTLVACAQYLIWSILGSDSQCNTVLLVRSRNVQGCEWCAALITNFDVMQQSRLL